MNKIMLTIGFIFCFNLTLFAHGVEALAFGIPIMIYFLILPIFISIWDYKNIIKYISSSEFSKRGLWFQNYLIGIVTYFLLLLVTKDLVISNTMSIFLLVVSLILMQTLLKSILYYIFNASKKVKVLEILNSIYILNITIIIASVGLGLILYWLIIID